MHPAVASDDLTFAGDDPPVPPGVAGDTGPLTPGQAFGSRYHIIRLFGIGGMGAVYQAWDAELGVSVAIKVIRPEIMADPTAASEVERRFKRELLLARQVTHKNVVRIHDLGEIDGIKYITMAFVDGVDLSSRLKQEGKLPVASVLRIARSVISGLVAAHAAGVVHRDLKPANIMIGPDDEALIMDFGIALSSGGGGRSLPDGALPAHLRSRAHASAALGTTTADGIAGTVEYMAPEQAKGVAVDQRADEYAVGLIMYDLLVGRQRGKHTDGPVTELQARMEHAPPPVRSLVADIPEPLDQLISRCLEPDPAKRYQTTAELDAALERLDEKGELIPIKRVVRLPLLAAVVAVLLASSVARLVVRALEDSAGAARPGLGGDRGLPERHQRFGVQRHARADAQARARRRRLHHRVRPRRYPAHARRAAARAAARRSGARHCRESRARRRARRLNRAAGRRLQDFGQGVAGRHRRGDHQRRGESRPARTRSSRRPRGSWRGSAARWVTRPPSLPRCSPWPACRPPPSTWCVTGCRAGTRPPGTTTTKR